MYKGLNLMQSNDQYNFTNQRPVPQNAMPRMPQRKKPPTSNLINRPINPQELSQAQFALRSLKQKMKEREKSKPKIAPNSGVKQRPATTTKNIQSNNVRPLNEPNEDNKFSYNNKRDQYTTYTNNANIYQNPTNNIKKNNSYHPPQNEDYEARPLDKGNNLMEVNQNMNPGENEETYECPDCGRNFAASSYQKHIKICKKVFQKKRKPFDMKAQRELKEQKELPKTASKEVKNDKYKKQNSTQQIKSNVPKWKKQSEDFRRMLQAGNNPTAGGAMMYTPSAITEDYTLCQFCNRKYNEEAYNKHLPGCERRFKEAQLKNKYKGSNTVTSKKYRK